MTIIDLMTIEAFMTFGDPEILENFEYLKTIENLELIEAFATSRCFRHKFLTFPNHLVTDIMLTKMRPKPIFYMQTEPISHIVP